MAELHAGFHLRPMVSDDLPEVCEIENAAQPTPWSTAVFQDCLNSRYQCDVVERDGQLVAFLVVSRVLDEAHLLNIVVAPGFQRRGLAWAMLKQLHAQCRGAGTSMVYLEVRASNLAAQALYQKLGYQESGRRRDYYRTVGGREDAVLMTLALELRP